MFATSRLAQAYMVFVLALVVGGMLLLSGCDGDGTTNTQYHQIEAIVISPQNAEIAVGEQQEFSAVAVDAAGNPVDLSGLNVEWEWWSTDPDVFTVEDDGTATGHSPGEEFCIVEATILQGSSNFTGRDSALVFLF